MNSSITSEALRALGYIFIAIIVYTSWMLGTSGLNKKNTSGNTNTYELTIKDCIIRLGKGILIIFVIAYIASYVSLGNSTDCSDETDPITGSCTTSVDYQPTSEQRYANFAYYITLLGLPYLAGGINKLSKIKNGEVEKEYQKHIQESAVQGKENARAAKRMMAEINANTTKEIKKAKRS
jgi:hypothetical protein